MKPVISIEIDGKPFVASGNVCLLDYHLTGLLCSQKYPADKILEAHGQGSVGGMIQRAEDGSQGEQ